jgi:hypothetical protein
LRRLQRIDFTANYDTGFQRLLKAIGLNEPKAAAAQTEEQKISGAVEKPSAVKPELAAAPKEKPVKIAPVAAGIQQHANEGSIETKIPLVIESKKKNDPKKVLFWALGIAAAALLVFVLVQNFSGKNCEVATTNDSTLLLGTTGQIKPVDTSSLSSEYVGGARLQGTTSTPNNDNITQTGNVKHPSSPDSAAERQKQFEDNRQSGMNNFNAKNYKEAIDDFSHALKLQEDAELYYYIGRSYVQIEDFPSAIEYYSKAINLAPNKSLYWGRRGQAHRDNKNYKAALNDFDQAVELDLHNGQPLYNRGLIRREMGDIDGACKDFASASQLGYEKAKTNYETYCVQKPSGAKPTLKLNAIKKAGTYYRPQTDKKTAPSVKY